VPCGYRHPIDPEAPAKPLVVALHNWAAVSRGWSLYRNDKSVTGSQEFTTRSWETSGAGENQALVLTTIRRADGTPSQHNADHFRDALQRHQDRQLTLAGIKPSDVAGLVGVAAMLGAYAGAQLRRLDPVKARRWRSIWRAPRW